MSYLQIKKKTYLNVTNISKLSGNLIALFSHFQLMVPEINLYMYDIYILYIWKEMFCSMLYLSLLRKINMPEFKLHAYTTDPLPAGRHLGFLSPNCEGLLGILHT